MLCNIFYNRKDLEHLQEATMVKPVAKEYYLGGDQREHMQSDYCEAKTCVLWGTDSYTSLVFCRWQSACQVLVVEQGVSKSFSSP